jgi:transcription initiation factor TFIIH subunit 2
MLDTLRSKHMELMDDSDDDYVDNVSPEDEEFVQQDGISRRTRGREPKNERLKGQSGGYAWEDEYHRSWDVVKEDARGSLAGVVAGIVEETKKRRMTKDGVPVHRGIIRNMVLILDMSEAMTEKDLRPNRYQLMLNYAIEFVSDFFDQNPISQLSIVGMKDGLAVMLSELEGNPNAHVSTLQNLRRQDPKGVPSLQNALEMARGILYHVPSHCTKEVVIVFGALLSSDPSDIHKTIDNLVKDKIRVRVIGLAAQVAVCQELATRTNFGQVNAYSVILNEQHFKELLLENTTPLAVSKLSTMNSSTLVEMGFPSRVSETEPSLCSCHSQLTQGGYICPRCLAKICTLPMLCPCCNLTLILSTHLARSLHHLFPLKSFQEVSSADKDLQSFCFSCLIPFPRIDPAGGTGRFVCPTCKNQFCLDCDVFCHETLHNCPGCETRPR